MVSPPIEAEKDLSGANGPAAQWAMRFLIQTAEAVGARRLVPVTRAHLVGAYHSGPANLRLLDHLIAGGAEVRIPTTLNASSADLRPDCAARYRGEAADQARAVVERLLAMKCRMSLSCAPYYLPGERPALGERIAWAESNAVLFANSVLGARTLKTPQYLDLAAALTGWMPETGELCAAGRMPDSRIEIMPQAQAWFLDPAGFELLGYWLGRSRADRVVYIAGLDTAPDEAALRSLCAAAGAAGDVRLIHVEGVTPEAERVKEAACAPGLPVLGLAGPELMKTARLLGFGAIDPVGAVCLGAPHYGAGEIGRLDRLAAGHDAFRLPVFVSAARETLGAADLAGARWRLEAKGVTFIADACTYYAPSIAEGLGPILTDSAKWAGYGRGNLDQPVSIATLQECLEAAASGRAAPRSAYWREGGHA